MKQIDRELQTMTDQFRARHDPVLTPLVCAWHFASAAMSKVRERKGDVSDPAIASALAVLEKCVRSHLPIIGSSDSKFDAAFIDLRRMTLTHHALQKIDEVNAL